MQGCVEALHATVFQFQLSVPWSELELLPSVFQGFYRACLVAKLWLSLVRCRVLAASGSNARGHLAAGLSLSLVRCQVCWLLPVPMQEGTLTRVFCKMCLQSAESTLFFTLLAELPVDGPLDMQGLARATVRFSATGCHHCSTLAFDGLV